MCAAGSLISRIRHPHADPNHISHVPMRTEVKEQRAAPHRMILALASMDFVQICMLAFRRWEAQSLEATGRPVLRVYQMRLLQAEA
jgi:hypothetical protein